MTLSSVGMKFNTTKGMDMCVWVMAERQQPGGLQLGWQKLPVAIHCRDTGMSAWASHTGDDMGQDMTQPGNSAVCSRALKAFVQQKGQPRAGMAI